MVVLAEIKKWSHAIRMKSKQARAHTENLTRCVKCAAVSRDMVWLEADFRASDRGVIRIPGVNSRKILREVLDEMGNPPTERIVGHHRDYARPTDVETLCDRCHMQEHESVKNGRRGQIDMFKPGADG